ncbi:MAG: alpha/beta hydrolase [Chloroflexi bacterium]|nr:alpha/beta hydrolase [Chloroflexota bacterium]
MPCHETTLTAPDGVSLFLRVWTPEQPPRAILVLVHGLSEHAGRYPHVAEAFLNQNYVIYGHDHRGYGRSGGPRGDYERFDDVLRDLDQVVTYARSQHPDLPLAMYAHSLGGMIATHYLARYGDKVDAALISAPGYGPGPDFSRVKLMLTRALAKIAPRLTIETSHDDAPFTLSHDPEAERAYRNDDLVHHTVTMRFAYTGIQKGREARRLLCLLKMPVMVILGEEDTTIDRQAVIDAASACPDKVVFRRYAGGYHELHNELPEIRNRVLADVIAWMNEQLFAKPGRGANPRRFGDDAPPVVSRES